MVESGVSPLISLREGIWDNFPSLFRTLVFRLKLLLLLKMLKKMWKFQGVAILGLYCLYFCIFYIKLFLRPKPMFIRFNFLQTPLPVEEITKALAKKGFEVMTSDDAGRFVCNYVYYHSLWFAEQNMITSLFVHVPLFLTIDEETQMQFVASLLEVLAALSQ